MKYFFYTLLLIAVIAFATKPTDEKCFSEVKSKLKEKMYSSSDTANLFLPGIAEMAINRGVKIQDRILYKEVLFTFGKITRRIGYGAFGNVYFTSVNKYEVSSE